MHRLITKNTLRLARKDIRSLIRYVVLMALTLALLGIFVFSPVIPLWMQAAYYFAGSYQTIARVASTELLAGDKTDAEVILQGQGDLFVADCIPDFEVIHRKLSVDEVPILLTSSQVDVSKTFLAKGNVVSGRLPVPGAPVPEVALSTTLASRLEANIGDEVVFWIKDQSDFTKDDLDNKVRVVGIVQPVMLGKEALHLSNMMYAVMSESDYHQMSNAPIVAGYYFDPTQADVDKLNGEYELLTKRSLITSSLLLVPLFDWVLGVLELLGFALLVSIFIKEYRHDLALQMPELRKGALLGIHPSCFLQAILIKQLVVQAICAVIACALMSFCYFGFYIGVSLRWEVYLMVQACMLIVLFIPVFVAYLFYRSRYSEVSLDDSVTHPA